jgi:hypothetical protein
MSIPVSSALRRIGWGLVFELIDIRIAYIDVLPDFIGYILLAAGLHALGTLHAGFRRARGVAIAMMLLTLPHVMMQSTVGMSDMSALPLWLHGYVELLLGLHVLMAYWLLVGLRDMARQTGDSLLEDVAQHRTYFYMSVNLAQLVLYPFLLNMGDDWTLVFIGLSVLAIIAELLLLRLPFRMAKKRPRTD